MGLLRGLLRSLLMGFLRGLLRGLLRGKSRGLLRADAGHRTADGRTDGHLNKAVRALSNTVA